MNPSNKDNSEINKTSMTSMADRDPPPFWASDDSDSDDFLPGAQAPPTKNLVTNGTNVKLRKDGDHLIFATDSELDEDDLSSHHVPNVDVSDSTKRKENENNEDNLTQHLPGHDPSSRMLLSASDSDSDEELPGAFPRIPKDKKKSLIPGTIKLVMPEGPYYRLRQINNIWSSWAKHRAISHKAVDVINDLLASPNVFIRWPDAIFVLGRL